MSEQEDLSETLFNQNEANPPLSSILQEEHNQNQPNDNSEIDISTVAEGEGNINPEQNVEDQPNFIAKGNIKDNHLENFLANGMNSQKHINAVILCERYDNYYLETLLNEFSNIKNKVFAFTESRNYVPKEIYLQGKLIKPYTMRPFFDYKIQIKDMVFCTYINEYYGPHRECYKLPQSANNSTT